MPTTNKTGPGAADTRPSSQSIPLGERRAGVFATTRWTQVQSAGGDTAESEGALAALCQAYWYPLYAFVRRSGRGPDDAEDLTQAFFVRLLGNPQWLAAADPARGRFRSYLLTMLKHFLADEWDRVRADKRGYQRVVSLDTKAAEDRYGRELEGSATNPDRVYERQWALTLLERVLDGLGGEYEATGRGALFARLRFALTGDRSTLPYAALGEELGMSEGAVKVAVHRLRQRYRELLRSEIAQTVDGPAEVEAELRHLFRALAG